MTRATYNTTTLRTSNHASQELRDIALQLEDLETRRAFHETAIEQIAGKQLGLTVKKRALESMCSEVIPAHLSFRERFRGFLRGQKPVPRNLH